MDLCTLMGECAVEFQRELKNDKIIYHSCCGKVFFNTGKIGYIVDEDKLHWKVQLESNAVCWIRRLKYDIKLNSYNYNKKSRSSRKVIKYLPIQFMVFQRGNMKLIMNRFSVDENNKIDHFNCS